jgi:hypothetical protein
VIHRSFGRRSSRIDSALRFDEKESSAVVS